MPRPIKEVVDYFPHYASASNGRTIFILEGQFGNNGYAFWFKLLELLASTKGHYYDFNNPPDWEFLLAKTRVSADIARNILNTLMVLGAIDQELYKNNVLSCQNLIDNLEPLYERRKSNLPQKPHYCKHKLISVGVSADNNPIDTSTKPQSKVKESKVKDINNTNIFELYENNIGILTPIISEKLKGLELHYPVDWIKKAIEQSVKYNKRSLAYVEAVLKDFDTSGSGGKKPAGKKYERVN